ncbi:hypothetical protein LBMAG10_16530 [Actinomycetes bacterium]|nr:hypothetical protein LBMAG10_16530 [Actinomycetes bacterium]
MNKFARILIALVVTITPLSAVTPAQAETCQEAITLWPGSPYERSFPRVCGEEARSALWNTQLGPYLDQYSAAAAQWFTAQAEAEQARRAAEEAARVAAAAAADAANCVSTSVIFPGTKWEMTFPGVCTAIGIAGRSLQIQTYSENVAVQQAAEAAAAAANQPLPPNSIDCNLELWRNAAQCINQNNGTTPLPIVPPLPTFNANSQPMVNPDGTINCAQADNAITTTCMNLFKPSANGTLDCTRGELKNLPACVNGTAPGGPNAPPPPTNVSAPTSNVPATTGGIVAQPSSPSSQNNSAPSSTQVASEKVKQNKEDLFPDADGEEEDPAANLTVTYSKSLARYIVKVDSNLAEESLVIRGVKKGAKSLKFTLNTDEDGVAGVKTKTKLSGFTLTLYFGSTKLDSVKVS